MIRYLQKTKRYTGCAENAAMCTKVNLRRKNAQTATTLRHIFKYFAKTTESLKWKSGSIAGKIYDK